MSDGKPGRPRQPNCPDCIRAGRTDVLKKPGYGYCGTHVNLRMRGYKRAAQDNIDVDTARQKELLDMLDELRSQVKYLKEENEQQEHTIANLLTPPGEDNPYLHPHPDDGPTIEDSLRSLQGAHKQLLEWAASIASKHGEEFPFYIKAQLDE